DERLLSRGEGKAVDDGVGGEEALADEDLAQARRLLARLAHFRLRAETLVELRLLDEPLPDEQPAEQRVLELGVGELKRFGEPLLVLLDQRVEVALLDQPLAEHDGAERRG